MWSGTKCWWRVDRSGRWLGSWDWRGSRSASTWTRPPQSGKRKRRPAGDRCGTRSRRGCRPCWPSRYGRLAAILERRAAQGPDAYVFGSATGAYQPNIDTAWETLRLLAHDIEPRRGEGGLAWNREQLRRIDLRWHDLRHEGACRLLADGVDIRIIQLMLGHASVQQTQRYLNVTDEELRRGLEVSWNNTRRLLRVAAGQ
jgi:integrase